MESNGIWGSFFISNIFTNQPYFICTVLVVIFSVSLHEFFHARMALAEGDTTAADRGHLTLNPFRQMGRFSLFMLMILGFCWGQVPINPSRMRSRYSLTKVALAGPAANLLLFFIFSLLNVLAIHYHGSSIIQLLTSLGMVLNIILFMFNMLPIPGLDGWTLLRSIFPNLLINRQELLSGITVFLVFIMLMYFSIVQQIAIMLSGSMMLFWMKLFNIN